MRITNFIYCICTILILIFFSCKSEKEKLTANIVKSVTLKLKDSPVTENVDSVIVLSIDTITQKKDLELKFWEIDRKSTKQSALLKEEIKLINLELTQSELHRDMGIGSSFEKYEKDKIIEHRADIERQAKDFKNLLSAIDSLNKLIPSADSVKTLYFLARVKVKVKGVEVFFKEYNVNQQGYVLN